MSQTLSTRDVKLGNWILSVTTRDTGDDPKILEELTYRTVIMWVNIVRRLEKENYVYEGGSVEQVYAAEINKRSDTDGPNVEPFEFKEPWGSDNSRVTVWSTFRGVDNPNFHLNSDDNPQTAIDVWRANGIGIERAYLKLESLMPKPSQPAQDAQQPASPPQTVQTPQNAPNASTAPNQPISGAIVATRAPNPNEQTYADGQLVEFSINKIVLGTHPNSGSVIYSLWGDLGKKYALKTVYVMDSKGTEKSYDYKAAEQVLNSLALSIPGKMQAEGNWKMICKASNSGAKQYMNIVSLY